MPDQYRLPAHVTDPSLLVLRRRLFHHAVPHGDRCGSRRRFKKAVGRTACPDYPSGHCPVFRRSNVCAVLCPFHGLHGKNGVLICAAAYRKARHGSVPGGLQRYILLPHQTELNAESSRRTVSEISAVSRCTQLRISDHFIARLHINLLAMGIYRIPSVFLAYQDAPAHSLVPAFVRSIYDRSGLQCGKRGPFLSAVECRHTPNRLLKSVSGKRLPVIISVKYLLKSRFVLRCGGLPQKVDSAAVYCLDLLRRYGPAEYHLHFCFCCCLVPVYASQLDLCTVFQIHSPAQRRVYRPIYRNFHRDRRAFHRYALRCIQPHTLHRLRDIKADLPLGVILRHPLPSSRLDILQVRQLLLCHIIIVHTIVRAIMPADIIYSFPCAVAKNSKVRTVRFIAILPIARKNIQSAIFIVRHINGLHHFTIGITHLIAALTVTYHLRVV